MQFCPLSTVKQRITLGAPLPFNVRDADRTLLLARGQFIASQEQLEALLARGALVDLDELRRPGAEASDTPVAELPSLWNQSLDRMGTVLRASVQIDFTSALGESASALGLGALGGNRSCGKTAPVARHMASLIRCTPPLPASLPRGAWAGTSRAGGRCSRPR